MKILLIIPAYNEEENILNTCKKIDEYNTKAKNKLDYVVINDGSKDRTEEILVKNKINHVSLIHNLGIGGAVQTGYKYARENGYDVAVQFDGDGQHDVEYVKNIVEPISKGEANMVIGSRFIEKDDNNFKSTLARRIGIRIISFFIKLFSEVYPTEYPEPVSEVSVLRKKYKVKEVYVKMHERQGGKSSIKAWKNAYYMINVTVAMFIESLKR